MKFLLLVSIVTSLLYAETNIQANKNDAKELSYKQIKLGMTSDELKDIAGLHFATCNSSICIEDSFGNTLAGASLERPVIIMMQNNRAGMIYMQSKSNNFNQIAEAYSLKYGVPTTQNESEVQNRMGAKFLNREYTWRTLDGYISLKERAKTVEKMSISIGLNSFIEKSVKESEKATQKHVEDL